MPDIPEQERPTHHPPLQALTSLIDKPAPGLVTLMLTHSLQITPMAALSRPVAGVRLSPNSTTGEGTLIVTLPGSTKGATENLESLIRVLPHLLELSRGGSGRETHAKFAEAEEEKKQAMIGFGGVVPGASVTVPAALAASHSHSHHHHDHSRGAHGHAMPKPRTALSLDPSSSGELFWDFFHLGRNPMLTWMESVLSCCPTTPLSLPSRSSS